MNRTIEQWSAINQYAFACNASFGDVRDIVEQAVSDLQELARQRDELAMALEEIASIPLHPLAHRAGRIAAKALYDLKEQTK